MGCPTASEAAAAVVSRGRIVSPDNEIILALRRQMFTMTI